LKCAPLYNSISSPKQWYFSLTCLKINILRNKKYILKLFSLFYHQTQKKIKKKWIIIQWETLSLLPNESKILWRINSKFYREHLLNNGFYVNDEKIENNTFLMGFSIVTHCVCQKAQMCVQPQEILVLLSWNIPLSPSLQERQSWICFCSDQNYMNKRINKRKKIGLKQRKQKIRKIY